MNTPKPSPLVWSAEDLVWLDGIRRDFHESAFGEEMARVNLEMNLEERLRYIDRMRELAPRRKPKEDYD